jgi:hypothetical protein
MCTGIPLSRLYPADPWASSLGLSGRHWCGEQELCGHRARFIGKIAATLSVTNVVLSFKDAGLDNEKITFVCVKPGRRCPNAATKKTVATAKIAQATFNPENGQVTASLMIIPLPTLDFCPSGQTAQLAEISFTNI